MDVRTAQSKGSEWRTRSFRRSLSARSSPVSRSSSRQSVASSTLHRNPSASHAAERQKGLYSDDGDDVEEEELSFSDEDMLLSQNGDASWSDADQPSYAQQNSNTGTGGDGKENDNRTIPASHSLSSRKRSRRLLTPQQSKVLYQLLEKTHFPSTQVREKVAHQLGISPRKVQVWFQNRRQVGKKKMMEAVQAAKIEASSKQPLTPSNHNSFERPRLLIASQSQQSTLKSVLGPVSMDRSRSNEDDRTRAWREHTLRLALNPSAEEVSRSNAALAELEREQTMGSSPPLRSHSNVKTWPHHDSSLGRTKHVSSTGAPVRNRAMQSISRSVASLRVNVAPPTSRIEGLRPKLEPVSATSTRSPAYRGPGSAAMEQEMLAAACNLPPLTPIARTPITPAIVTSQRESFTEELIAQQSRHPASQHLQHQQQPHRHQQQHQHQIRLRSHTINSYGSHQRSGEEQHEIAGNGCGSRSEHVRHIRGDLTAEWQEKQLLFEQQERQRQRQEERVLDWQRAKEREREREALQELEHIRNEQSQRQQEGIGAGMGGVRSIRLTLPSQRPPQLLGGQHKNQHPGFHERFTPYPMTRKTDALSPSTLARAVQRQSISQSQAREPHPVSPSRFPVVPHHHHQQQQKQLGANIPAGAVAANQQHRRQGSSDLHLHREDGGQAGRLRSASTLGFDHDPNKNRRFIEGLLSSSTRDSLDRSRFHPGSPQAQVTPPRFFYLRGGRNESVTDSADVAVAIGASKAALPRNAGLRLPLPTATRSPTSASNDIFKVVGSQAPHSNATFGVRSPQGDAGVGKGEQGQRNRWDSLGSSGQPGHIKSSSSLSSFSSIATTAATTKSVADTPVDGGARGVGTTTPNSVLSSSSSSSATSQNFRVQAKSNSWDASTIASSGEPKIRLSPLKINNGPAFADNATGEGKESTPAGEKRLRLAKLPSIHEIRRTTAAPTESASGSWSSPSSVVSIRQGSGNSDDETRPNLAMGHAPRTASRPDLKRKAPSSSEAKDNDKDAGREGEEEDQKEEDSGYRRQRTSPSPRCRYQLLGGGQEDEKMSYLEDEQRRDQRNKIGFQEEEGQDRAPPLQERQEHELQGPPSALHLDPRWRRRRASTSAPSSTTSGNLDRESLYTSASTPTAVHTSGGSATNSSGGGGRDSATLNPSSYDHAHHSRRHDRTSRDNPPPPPTPPSPSASPPASSHETPPHKPNFSRMDVRSLTTATVQ